MWQYRPSADALEPLLLFAVVIGAAHVVLGVGLGAWQAARFGESRTVFDKLGTLLALGGLFGVAGWAADHLPPGAITPSVAATIVGLVLVMSLHGALGIVTGALELVGAIGNILSYLRLAAVGLASAHLAARRERAGDRRADLDGRARRRLLPLAQPCPGRRSARLIQALRLHYVEFFGTFLVGGGRAFSPFGHRRELQTPPTN